MFNSFFNLFKNIIIIIMGMVIFLSVFFTPIINQATTIVFTEDEFAWPVPECRTISSHFGKRGSPTTGASSYHKGIDIAAKEGQYFIAVMDGEITFAEFLGGGGYTITLNADVNFDGKIQNIKITYCHVSPNYIVKVGDIVKKGQVIGYVGPKNVYGVVGNKYKDSSGKPTNGATTGPHLHLGVRINGNYINPLLLFDKEF